VAGLTSDKAVAQLATVKYGHDPRGRVFIEKKADARKRGVPSPDWAEMVMLLFAKAGAPIAAAAEASVPPGGYHADRRRRI
jgi:hypothetical protein